MNKEELLVQLMSLKINQADFISNDVDDIFKKDCKALELAIKIIKEVDLNDLEHLRVCSNCGKLMSEGYCIDNGLEYYCSDECLHKHYTWEEYEEMYNYGEDTYYTSWEE